MENMIVVKKRMVAQLSLLVAGWALTCTYLIVSPLHAQTDAAVNDAAANDAAATKAEPRSAAAEQGVLISANRLQGATLLDSAGISIGSVSEVTLGLDNHAVHLVVDVGGLLGVGAHAIAIPLPAVRLRPAEESGDAKVWLSLNISQSALEKAPTLMARDRLELTDVAWTQRNATFYGLSPSDTTADSQQATRPLRVITVAELIDQEVLGQVDSVAIAYLDDILLGFNSSPLEYAILGYGGALGIGKEYVAIPFKDIAVKVQPPLDSQPLAAITITAPYNSKTLSEAQHVTPSGFPELRLNSVRQRIEDSQ